MNDTSKKQEMSLTEPRCQTVPIWLGEVAAMVDTQALRFISARGKIQRNSKMEYGPVHLICQCATAVDQTKPGAHFIGYLGLDT